MYQIGKIKIEINHLDQINNSSRLELFKVNDNTFDMSYDVEYCSNLLNYLDFECIYVNEYFMVMKKDGHSCICYHINQYIYAVLEEIDNCHSRLYLDEKYAKKELHPYFLPSLLRLEKPLIDQSSFILHSSCVAYQNQSILFTAPTGGGKSTQADLWKKYKGAKIINGDKNIIGRNQGTWYSFGIPFSGSSDDCLNESYPIKAVIILDKGKENQLIPLNRKAFSHLFSQVTVNPWDKDFCSKIMELVSDFCCEMPVYYFSCTKDENAVNVLFNELFKG